MNEGPGPGGGPFPEGVEEDRRKRAEDEGPVGIFPSWRGLYATVLVYGMAVILVLWALTRFLDPGTGALP